MTDAERVLHVLLHDLRTPIGVAQGYLRMMHEGRMTAAEDASRAITKAIAALAQTARLCEAAGEYLDATSGPLRTAEVEAAGLVNLVVLAATSQSLSTSTGRIPAEIRLALAGDTARLADAIVLTLSTAGGKRGLKGSIQAEADGDELRFVAADSTDASELPTPSLVPFDGWSHGLPVAVACRRIAWSSGRIQKFGAGKGLIVTFPVTGTGKDAIE